MQTSKAKISLDLYAVWSELDTVEYHNNLNYWDKWAFANSVDPDQTPQYMVSD